MRFLIDWLDDRTGIRDVVHDALYERIPGGARWRYVWGSTLVFAFVTQVVTGTFLWMAYSPSSQTAWESVYHIQHHMTGGWLLRGIHHFMAQAMVILLAVHLLQVIIDGAYRAPREVNFWLGLILMKIVLGLSLTGYLLPWDQKGYWATSVATNLMTLVPVVGEDLQRLVVGGANYGHHTLTRFFALHAGVLPGALIAFLALHVALFRRHGIKARESDHPDAYFWPDQILKDGVACLAVLAIVLLFAIRFDIGGALSGSASTSELGAELFAPAEPSESYAAARPEWYFLPLFEMLKPDYFQSEFVGAIVVPGVLFGILALMPIVGHWELGHRFNILFVSAVLCGAAFLMWRAVRADRFAVGSEYVADKYEDPARQTAYQKKFYASRDFQTAKRGALQEAERIHHVIEQRGGIPPTGAITLFRSDPEIQGPKLFALHCAGCHHHLDADGQGIASEEPSAPNLYGFASRGWIAGILDPERVAGPDYYGNTAHSEGDMVGFVSDNLADLDASEQAQVQAVTAALSAEARLPGQVDLDADLTQIEAGKEGMAELGCFDCHKFHDEGDLGMAPDLTNYGSSEWLFALIANPADDRFYPDTNDRMPAFAEHPDLPEKNLLSSDEITILVRWLRGDDRLAAD